LTGSLFEKEDIVEGKKPRRERDKITAASAAYLNNAVELTGKKLVLFPSSSPRALGIFIV
jgi:hypothetical protein